MFFVDAIVQFGELVIKAIELFQQIAENAKATTLLIVDNHLNESALNCRVLINNGVLNTTLPYSIPPGYEEGFVAQGKGGQGIDMMLSCSVVSPFGSKMRFAILFQIQPNIVGKKPNHLGVTLFEESPEFLADQLTFVAKNSDKFPESTEFKNEALILQCRTKDMVIQATMSTSHKSKITVKLLPSDINFIPNITLVAKEDLSSLQDQLTAMINLPQSCPWSEPSLKKISSWSVYNYTSVSKASASQGTSLRIFVFAIVASMFTF